MSGTETEDDVKGEIKNIYLELKKLLIAMNDQTCQVTVMIAEFKHSTKNQNKMEEIQIVQGRLVRQIEKDYGERIVRLETQRDGFMNAFWRIGTPFAAVVAALASVMLVLKQSGQL